MGGGIENPANAALLLAAAGMLRTAAVFRDRRGLAGMVADKIERYAFSEPAAIAAAHHPLLVCENDADAKSVYGFRLPIGSQGGLVVGNERFGVAHEFRALADQTVAIPLASARLTSLNVAAAAAVALYHVGNPLSTAQQARRGVERLRPDLLLLGATDHFELGSTLRSAAAFGWRQVLVDDRAGVWFGVDREVRAEGRAAARRARNSIHLHGSTPTDHYSYDEVVVIRASSMDRGLQRVRLTGGSRQLVVLPDESGGPGVDGKWERLGKRVIFASLDVEATGAYRYRLASSIALSEVARQLGTGAASQPGRRRGLTYGSTLGLVAPEPADTMTAEELAGY